MSVTVCPSCGFEVREPEPEWVDEMEIYSELCDHCSREFHGDDETRVP